jgi:recombination protein RecA
MFGSPETTTGGNALKFYASMRLDIRRVGAIKVGEVSVGNRTRVKVVKNKLAPPFTETEFDVLYGEGISKSGDLIDLAVADNILEKSGAWFSYGGERVGQGRENARNYLQERPKMLAEIEAKVLQKHGLSRGGKAGEAAAVLGSDNAKAETPAKSASAAPAATAKSTDAKAADAKADVKAADTKSNDVKADIKANDVKAAQRPRA